MPMHVGDLKVLRETNELVAVVEDRGRTVLVWRAEHLPSVVRAATLRDLDPAEADAWREVAFSHLRRPE